MGSLIPVASVDKAEVQTKLLSLHPTEGGLVQRPFLASYGPGYSVNRNGLSMEILELQKHLRQ